VVYEAEDVKLRRHVALKFLPDELARDGQALSRFQREAKAESSLNHPSICTIYEVDEADGRVFISMELLEGQTLPHRIAGKPLEIEAVLDPGIQISDALSQSHLRSVASGSPWVQSRFFCQWTTAFGGLLENPGYAGIPNHEQSLLTYCCCGDCAPLEPLPGHLPVPLPIP
jgi:serine/threonine protein kinase